MAVKEWILCFSDEDKLGQFLHTQWSVGENGSVLNTTYDMQDNVELTHRPKYIFPEIGTYTVGKSCKYMYIVLLQSNFDHCMYEGEGYF